MPTPNEWLENLERLQKFSNPFKEEPKVEPQLNSLEEAVEGIHTSMEVAAQKIIDLIDGTGPDDRVGIVAGFLTLLVTQVIMIVAKEQDAYEQQDR